MSESFLLVWTRSKLQIYCAADHFSVKLHAESKQRLVCLVFLLHLYPPADLPCLTFKSQRLKNYIGGGGGGGGGSRKPNYLHFPAVSRKIGQRNRPPTPSVRQWRIQNFQTFRIFRGWKSCKVPLTNGTRSIGSIDLGDLSNKCPEAERSHQCTTHEQKSVQKNLKIWWQHHVIKG